MPDKYTISHYENNVDFVPDFVEGKYDIPVIYPEEYTPVEWVRFHDARTMTKCKKYGIHFFENDYHFQNIWVRREKYQHMFLRFGAVMSPGFSTYIDWPFMVQLWNHYRRHLIGAWMQDIGCKVYPTILWGDKRSYDFCFDGEPRGATVCVSSVGLMKDKELKRMFIDGYQRMMEELYPETIIFYGIIPNECDGNIIPVEPYYYRFKEKKHDND